jgi:hypothetical protein
MCQKGLLKKASAVQERRLSPTFAASRYGMTHTALHYRIKKISSGDKCNRPSAFTLRYTSRQIFSENRELILVDYIIECSNLNYGMTYKQIWLAYDYDRLQCKFPVAGLITRLQGLIGYRAL